MRRLISVSFPQVDQQVRPHLCVQWHSPGLGNASFSRLTAATCRFPRSWASERGLSSIVLDNYDQFATMIRIKWSSSKIFCMLKFDSNTIGFQTNNLINPSSTYSFIKRWNTDGNHVVLKQSWNARFSQDYFLCFYDIVSEYVDDLCSTKTLHGYR